MDHEYAKPFIGMYLGDQPLLSTGQEAWKVSVPEANSTLWRYMDFAKFYSLMERQELFFSLVSVMQDKYEGFISPPRTRDQLDRLSQAERIGYEVLLRITKSCLVNCWVISEHESSLMWSSYAGKEGIAIRTTFQDLEASICSRNTKLPITFGKIDYVDYRHQETPRFNFAPLFHKRVEYRGEQELRAILPGPPFELSLDQSKPLIDMKLDPDVDVQKGRFIPVDLKVLVKEVVVAPHCDPSFHRLVNLVVDRSPIKPRVIPSNL